MFSVYHDQKDGSEFSDVTLASEDDNNNSDVIVLKTLEKFGYGYGKLLWHGAYVLAHPM